MLKKWFAIAPSIKSGLKLLSLNVQIVINKQFTITMKIILCGGQLNLFVFLVITRDTEQLTSNQAGVKGSMPLTTIATIQWHLST